MAAGLRSASYVCSESSSLSPSSIQLSFFCRSSSLLVSCSSFFLALYGKIGCRYSLVCPIPPSFKFSDLSILALTFVLAPLPNALFAHCGSDELSSNYEGSAPVDLGRFITSMFVVTGFALPIVLAHSNVIDPKACVMSITGGGWVTFNVPHS